MPSPPPDGLAAALLDSDRRYFELGADTVAIDGAVLCRMTGLESLAGAVVVQRVDDGAIADPERWVAEVDCRLRDAGVGLARVYLADRSHHPTPLESALASAGYRPRVEIGYLATVSELATHLPARTCSGVTGTGVGAGAGARPETGPAVALRAVASDDAWEEKHKLHAGSAVASDGHESPAADWVELERRKCETGGMEAFLIEVESEVCGAVATLPIPGQVLRAKNVFVHPDRRRLGLASETIRVLARRARKEGFAATGIFGVEGNAGNAVYVGLGMTPVVRQVEWARNLGTRQ